MDFQRHGSSGELAMLHCITAIADDNSRTRLDDGNGQGISIGVINIASITDQRDDYCHDNASLNIAI